MVLLTEPELAHLTGEADREKGARMLLDIGASMVVVKRGPDGLVVYTAASVIDVPGLPLGI